MNLTKSVKSLLIPISGLLFVFFILLGLIFIFVPDNIDNFLSMQNFKTILKQTVIVGIGALAMTMIIVSGGIDLSAGSVVALTAVFCAHAVNWLDGDIMFLGIIPTPIILSIFVGALIGFANGTISARLNIAPFIVTLGMMLIARGLAEGFADQSVVRTPDNFLKTLMMREPKNEWMIFAPGVWINFILFLVTMLIMRASIFGRYIYALGANEDAAKYSGIANYWKYFIGQSKGLKSMRVYDKKVETENMLKLWIDSANTDIKEKYGNTMQILEEAYEKNTKVALNRTYLTEAIFQGPEILSFSYTMKNRINALPKDKEAKSQAIRKLKKLAKEFYKNYNAKVDQEMLAAMLEMYYYNVPKFQHSKIFKKIENQLFGVKKLDFNYYAKNLFNRSYFSSEEKCLRFLKNPSKLLVEKDPAYITVSSIYNKYLEELYPLRKEVRDLQRKGNRLFISALREMDTIKKFYPDANSTMRVTYGNVRDYKPGEAMLYDYYTTINGVMEKEDPTNDEFIVPKKLKELYKAGDFGRYSDNNGNLRVNFISNNDITGGNSGSPVINAWGEIVGTAFDGNWEAMSGDIAFEKNIQRTISVDIRYILFVIDKYANASYLIDEMTLAPIRE
mgnify:CR=1 FL=1